MPVMEVLLRSRESSLGSATGEPPCMPRGWLHCRPPNHSFGAAHACRSSAPHTARVVRSVRGLNTHTVAADCQFTSSPWPVADELSPDRLEAEWRHLKRVLPSGHDEGSVKAQRRLFYELGTRERHGAQGDDGLTSLSFAAFYRGLVNVLHLNRMTPGLRILVERGYLAAHMRRANARRATQYADSGASMNTWDNALREVDHLSRGDLRASSLHERRVGFKEFTLVLNYLHDYFELNTSLRRRFVAAGLAEDGIPMRQWPCVVAQVKDMGVPVPDPSGLFHFLDTGRRGAVSVDAVCAWAAGHRLGHDGLPHSCLFAA